MSRHNLLDTEADSATTDGTTNDTPMTSYDFIQNDGSTDNDQTTFGGFSWSDHPGDHTSVSDDTQSALDAALDRVDEEMEPEVAEALQDISDELPGSDSVTNFQCSHPDCGLTHGHPENKHHIRNPVDCRGVTGFGVTDEFAESIEFVPNCHCGANEMAMLVRFVPYFGDQIEVFSDGEQFRSVFQLPGEVVNESYREWQESGESVMALLSESTVSMMAVCGVGVEELEAWFERRQHIESGGNSAPIAQYTQSCINDLEAEVEYTFME